jgi:hypothetical protein
MRKSDNPKLVLTDLIDDAVGEFPEKVSSPVSAEDRT